MEVESTTPASIIHRDEWTAIDEIKVTYQYSALDVWFYEGAFIETFRPISSLKFELSDVCDVTNLTPHTEVVFQWYLDGDPFGDKNIVTLTDVGINPQVADSLVSVDIIPPVHPIEGNYFYTDIFEGRWTLRIYIYDRLVGKNRMGDSPING